MHTPTVYDSLAACYTLDCAGATHSGKTAETGDEVLTHEHLIYLHI